MSREVVVEPALDLDDERRSPGEADEKAASVGIPSRGAAEGGPGEVGGLALAHEPGRGGEPVEREVVEHDGLAVGRVLHVAFDRESGRDRGVGGGERVLDQAGPRVMQPAMGDRARDEPVRRAHRTSNIASTSTAASSGSSATPIVERACRPRSPSTATIRSEAPFITCAKPAKLGSALMKPPSRTQRDDAFEVAHRGAHLGQHVDGAEPRRRLARLERHLAPELALMGIGDLAVRAEADLARDDDEVSGANERQVVRDRGRRGRQRDAEFLQTSIRRAHRLLRATFAPSGLCG